MAKPKHIGEEFKKIPKNIGKLTEEEALDFNEDEEGAPEDLVSITQRTNKAFYKGNGDISREYQSPEEVLKDYQEFN
jgi:hypothetical protein